MKKLSILNILIPLSLFSLLGNTAEATGKASAVAKNNHYPIVLVHGFTGWGRDEMLGFKYWGGFNDIEQNLTSKGYKTLTASVGPFSSNWDRLCELYAYIKGGTVDYGAAHALKYGHERFGRTYPGLYPEWDGEHKVHLVGHSLGGMTIRELLEVLEYGSHEELSYYAAHPETGISPLFQGGKSWVSSITTLAAVHNGSTFADDAAETIQTLIINIGKLAGIPLQNYVYDFKLDQWGLRRQPGESFISYSNRVFASELWSSADAAVYDGKTQAAGDIRDNRTSMHSHVYYFSYAGDSTYKNLLTGHHLPTANTNPLFILTALQIGQTKLPGLPYGYQAWRPNDGFLNTISQLYPFGQSYVNVSDTAKSYQKGVWNVFPVKKDWDHFDFIGLTTGTNFIGNKAINDYFESIAKRLSGLDN